MSDIFGGSAAERLSEAVQRAFELTKALPQDRTTQRALQLLNCAQEIARGRIEVETPEVISVMGVISTPEGVLGLADLLYTDDLPGIVRALEGLENDLVNARQWLDEVDHPDDSDTVSEELSQRIDPWLSGLQGLLSGALSNAAFSASQLQPVNLRPSAGEMVGSALSRLHEIDLRKRVEEVSELADRAERAQHSLSEAAGERGVKTLYDHFEAFEGSQRKAATWWMRVTLGSLVVIAVLALLFVGFNPDLTGVGLARRAVVGFPLVILAGVAARQWTVHRNHSLWADHLAVQLQSILAYSEMLSETERERLLSDFGRIVFAGPPPFAFTVTRDADRTHEAVVPLAEVQKMLDTAVRAARS